MEILEVAMLMRATDYEEFAAVAPADNRADLTRLLLARYGDRRDVLCVSHKNIPVAIGGALELRPRVLTLLFFATPEFAGVYAPLTRFIKQRLFPPLVAAGAHRIEAVSMESHTDAHRWIEALGLEKEGPPMRGYGKRGESFQQFAWVGDVRSAGT